VSSRPLLGLAGSSTTIRKSSRGGARSWLLIKHRDDWSGDLDITEFAPRSVKSDGDLEDILAADEPAIWRSGRPAKGGDSGKMLAEIIERAAQIKAGRKSDKTTVHHEVTKKRKTTKTRKAQGTKPKKSS
jgi:hypothetical protein